MNIEKLTPRKMKKIIGDAKHDIAHLEEKSNATDIVREKKMFSSQIKNRNTIIENLEGRLK